MSYPIERAHYLLSAHNAQQLPSDDAREVAFAGRSNAGKSTALNALTRQNALARVSKVPGRTQQLNYFQVQPKRYLVDLPGYGYARVPQSLQLHWQTFLSTFFATRRSLCGLVLLMDIRHPLKKEDMAMLAYAHAGQLPVHIVLTKADKLGRGQQCAVLQKMRTQLKTILPDQERIQVFSGATRLGVDTLREVVNAWLDL